jgi:hypothetical protein
MVQYRRLLQCWWHLEHGLWFDGNGSYIRTQYPARPGTKDVDFSVFKIISLHEAGDLELRSEFLNLFDTPQFNNPGNSVGTGAFGMSPRKARQPHCRGSRVKFSSRQKSASDNIRGDTS